MTELAAAALPDLEQLLDRLGLRFRAPALLEQALRHRSYLNERSGSRLDSNERMEFLGDAVLAYLAARFLYDAHPELSEGKLTSYRAAIVRTQTLARFAQQLDLGSYLYLGRGERLSGGSQRPVLLAAAFEALLAAIVLDQGLSAAEEFLRPLLAEEVERVIHERLDEDYKSRLQEVSQAHLHATPRYRVVREEGPDHAKEFWVEVTVAGDAVACGSGRSKQIAEQDAARQGLEVLLSASPRGGE